MYLSKPYWTKVPQLSCFKSLKLDNQGSTQELLSGGIKLIMLCVILEYITYTGRFFRGTGRFEPLPISVGRTLDNQVRIDFIKYHTQF